MYKAYVVKIKTRPLPNADNLVLGECNGYQVIVGKDTEDGQLGVFFEQGGQLDEEFATTNDLIRRRNPDGSPAGGMFEANRKVRAIKLRGSRSDGFFCNFHHFDYTGYDTSLLKEGDQFDELNGHKICQRFETKATKKAAASNRIKLHKDTIMMPKHFDTGQFKRMADFIPAGSLIYISEKMHGCLTYNSKIQMADGTVKNFNKVKTGEMVLGFNHKTNSIVPSKVLKKFDGGKAEKWLNVRVNNAIAKGNNFISIACTPEHWFYSMDRQDYVPASDLRVNENLLYRKETLNLTYTQEAVIAGKLLGDGCVLRKKSGWGIEFGHTEKDKGYVNFTVAALGQLGRKNNFVRTSGYGSKIHTGICQTNHFIKQGFSSWFKGKKKIVPLSAINQISDLSLAIWYMDDGSLAHTEKQKDRVTFAVCGFDDESCENLMTILDRYNVSSVLYKDSEGYNRIRLNEKDAETFFKVVRPYIPPCMYRKLPPYHQGYYTFNENETELNRMVSLVIPYQVLSVTEKPTESERYDMETETHNYFAHNILVHNTSMRLGHVEDNLPLNIVQKHLVNLAYKVNTNFGNVILKKWTKKQWVHLNGSRNVIIEKRKDPESGFYGKEQFRFKMTEGIALHKGEVIYGEIVGWTENGVPIMRPQGTNALKDKRITKTYGELMTYKYGHIEGECGLFIYRITQVNQDGYQVDLSWPQVVKRCKELGLKTIPVLEFRVYDGNIEKLKEDITYLVDGEDGSEALPSWTDPSHIREGVVLRIENEEGISFLKEKSWIFGVLEVYLKEDEEYVDTEESA